MWRLDSGQIRFTTRVKHSVLFALIWNIHAPPFLCNLLRTTWCRHKYTKGLLQQCKPFKCKPAGRQPQIELSGKQIYSSEITFYHPFRCQPGSSKRNVKTHSVTYVKLLKKKKKPRKNKCQKLVSLQKTTCDLNVERYPPASVNTKVWSASLFCSQIRCCHFTSYSELNWVWSSSSGTELNIHPGDNIGFLIWSLLR